jgi:hypothetical protein
VKVSETSTVFVVAGLPSHLMIFFLARPNVIVDVTRSSSAYRVTQPLDDQKFKVRFDEVLSCSFSFYTFFFTSLLFFLSPFRELALNRPQVVYFNADDYPYS